MQAISYFFFRIILYVTSIFPLAWMRKLGSAFGAAYYRLDLKRVHISRVNIKLCKPHLSEQEQEQLVQENLRSVGRWIFELGRVWLWPSKKLLTKVHIRNEALFLDAMSSGKGVLLAMPHMGNWEVIQPYLCSKTKPAGLYKPHKKNKYISDFVRHCRSRGSTEMGATNVAGLRLLMKALAKGKAVVVLPDHNPSKDHGVLAPFFGRPVLTTTLIHSMARRSGAEVLVAVALRVPDGWEMVFHKVPDQHVEDPKQATAALNQAVEDCIAEAPEQFQWVYPRFRGGSGGLPCPY